MTMGYIYNNSTVKMTRWRFKLINYTTWIHVQYPIHRDTTYGIPGYLVLCTHFKSYWYIFLKMTRFMHVLNNVY